MQTHPVCLGTAAFGTAMSKAESFGILDQYATMGGRCIDTANNYAFWRGQGGESEAVIGEWLANVDRAHFTVMTKIGSQPVEQTPDPRGLEGLSSQAIHRAVDKSLERLGIDQIDLLLAHHDDPHTPLLETWEALGEQVAQGRAAKIGVSNYSTQRLAELVQIVDDHQLVPLDVLQLQYSPLVPVAQTDAMLVRFDTSMRDLVAQILPQAIVFAYSPLLGGRVFDIPEDADWPSAYDTEANREQVAYFRRQAQTMGVSVSAFVLKTIADEGLHPITATSKVDRLVENLALVAGAAG
ncbi:MAG: aldo/keto reductase [Gemmatimonadetes bacterium]|jgi:aryl-alcohol dehydrogenase-like predicted oxidoreductase|nr:aldo/keto reductase [Gemmatimonadota bacterium]MBT4611953.1 aldo/keto reductase [Gemmatimonadota bacterium]MBT5059486.1 aldo/keto reductase [Gemmatimonadota bacterium]MBT5146789.1 aldo/keto reductase [Gemmatimonadota bacterium]MBT5590078.1 aldo/keto reductase [Gemmatimonadota bacterium]